MGNVTTLLKRHSRNLAPPVANYGNYSMANNMIPATADNSSTPVLRLFVSPRPNAPTFGIVMEIVKEIERALRPIIREEVRAESDRKSFAAASGRLTIEEAGEYIRTSRAEMSRLRHARKIAKSDAEKDAIFAPEYGEGRKTTFKRVELDAWLDRQKR